MVYRNALSVDQQCLRVGRTLINRQEHTSYSPLISDLSRNNDRAAEQMPEDVRPKYSSRNSADPVGAKTSGRPKIRIGTGWFRTTVSATAPPSPPAANPSSAVTIPRVSRAALSTASVS